MYLSCLRVRREIQLHSTSSKAVRFKGKSQHCDLQHMTGKTKLLQSASVSLTSQKQTRDKENWKEVVKKMFLV